MYKTLPIKLNLSNEEKVYWTEQCQHSNSLFNCGLYEVKSNYYKQLEIERKYSTYWRGDELRAGWNLRKALGINYNALDKLLKLNKHYKGLPSQAAQQTLKVVASSIDAFNKLVDAFFAGTVDKPRLPRYRKSGGLFAVSFPTTNLKFANGAVKLPVTSNAKPEMICDTWIDIPEFVITEQIKQIRIRPSRGEFWCDFVIDDGKPKLEVNSNLEYNQALAIDHGVKF